MKKVAVVLSGCGHRDGAEITESVSTLIALSELGADYKIFAPNLDFTAFNHLSSTPDSKSNRNCLVESARIARGHAYDLRTLNPENFDGLIFPGGFGAALHLSTWATDGAQCVVLPEIERILQKFHQESKPIGAICIAPVLVAKVLGKLGITLTLGDDLETAQEVQKTGAIHISCPVEDYITDRLHKVISTPAYMYDTEPHRVFKGIRGLVTELVTMA